MSAETLTVRWPKKFGKQTVIIDAASFDPKLHERVEASESAPAAEEDIPLTAEPETHQKAQHAAQRHETPHRRR